MRLTEASEALRAIDAGHVFWHTRRRTGIEFYLLTDSLDASGRRSWRDAYRRGVPLPTLAKMSERFYERDGWKDGHEGGRVSLTPEGRRELVELLGSRRASIWDRTAR